MLLEAWQKKLTESLIKHNDIAEKIDGNSAIGLDIYRNNYYYACYNKLLTCYKSLSLILATREIKELVANFIQTDFKGFSQVEKSFFFYIQTKKGLSETVYKLCEFDYKKYCSYYSADRAQWNADSFEKLIPKQLQRLKFYLSKDLYLIETKLDLLTMQDKVKLSKKCSQYVIYRDQYLKVQVRKITEPRYLLLQAITSEANFEQLLATGDANDLLEFIQMGWVDRFCCEN